MDMIDIVATAIKNVSGYSLEQLSGRDRHWPLPWLRYICYDVLAEDGYSTAQIGWVLGRDHSTVLHGLRMVKNMDDRHGYSAERRLRDDFRAEIRRLADGQAEGDTHKAGAGDAGDAGC